MSKKAVLNAEKRWAKAFLELDIKTISELMDDNYTLIQQDGSIENKEQVLASLHSRQRQWESTSSDQHDIRLYGNVAVVIARWQSKGINHGKVFDYATNYMAVWIKRKEGWRIVADQSTPISAKSTSNYWIFKSEPDEFSFNDLLNKSFEPWTGVRNYQARNFLREIKAGDNVLFYHSSTKVPAIVGIAEVIRTHYPDPTQFDKKSKYYDQGSKPDNPRWVAVDVKAVEALKNSVTLETIKTDAALQNMRLVKRGNRLSVMPVSKEAFERILELANLVITTIP